MQLTGEQGKKLAAHIAEGKFEKSSGFNKFISSLSKTARDESDLLHNTKVANQTFDKANELLAKYKDPSLLYFEYKGDFDIDLGVKNIKTLDPMFEEVYQLKNLRTTLNYKSLEKAAEQLLNASSVKRALHMECDEKTTLDVLNNLENAYQTIHNDFFINTIEIKLQGIAKPFIIENGKKTW